MDSREVLRVEHLQKHYKQQAILEDVSFTLEVGTATALIGGNGTGKTTFIRILAGLAYPEAGSLSLFGQTGEKGLQEARRQTGFLVDSAPGDRYRNVERNLLLRAGLYGKPDRKYLRGLMKRLRLTEREIGTRRVGKLSLGQQGRCALASALVNKPRFLVLDEPFIGMDAESVALASGLLNELRQEGTTLLLSGHVAEQLRLVCSQTLLLEDGSVRGPVPMDEAEREGSSLPSLDESCGPVGNLPDQT